MTGKPTWIAIVALGLAAADHRLAAARPKPTAAAARAVATAWLEAMDLQPDPDASEPPPTAAIALTASPLVAEASAEETPACPATTARTADEVGRALRCLRAHVSAEGELLRWTSATARREGVPRQRAATLRRLARTSTLVLLDNACLSGIFNQVVFAVSRGADGTARVTAVIAQSGFCGE